MSVKLSSKYQVVIPENVRKSLKLKPGVQIDVVAKGGIAYLVPVKSLENLKDLLKNQLSTEDQKDLRDKKERAI
ncbi:MAG TPA: AbrB/MazE/SpoVT family DNA-binding domain-containing protein [Pseudobdellovibrionaceae bacterium]|nr:AbrB/MazE/SpoVT family DNA-binding domain-containing protein [Pseudobdellovibrionaceae bacterium]